jgi:hypothetical protein
MKFKIKNKKVEVTLTFKEYSTLSLILFEFMSAFGGSTAYKKELSFCKKMKKIEKP